MSEPLIRSTPELWFWACLVVAAMVAGALAFQWLQRRLDARRFEAIGRVFRAPDAPPDYRDSLARHARELQLKETRR